MKITWFTTASILIETEKEKLLFDPFIPLEGAENKVAVSDYGKDNKIFITHGHIDHLGSISRIIEEGNNHIFCTSTPANYLIMPYKGNSDLITPALQIIGTIKPKSIILDHFDDAFPPISKTIETKGLEVEMGKRFPDIRIIKPETSKSIILN